MSFKFPHRQHGFTLTEILVAVAIGLISTVVIFKALQNSNIVSKNVNGGSDSNTTGLVGLYMVERDIRQAGYGLNDETIVGCNVHYQHSDLTLPTDINNGTAILAPAVVNTDASGNPMIRIAYAGYKNILHTRLTRNYNGGVQPITVVNNYGSETPGTVLLLGGYTKLPGQAFQVFTNSPSGANPNHTPCVIQELSRFVSPEMYMEPDTVTGKLNPATGHGIAMDQETKVFNLGSIAPADLGQPSNIPVWNEYRVNKASATLEVKNLFLEDTYRTVANNIVDMYADYIMRDGTETDAEPTSTQEWNNVVGIRMALLSRSTSPDYSKGTVCRTDPTNVDSITQPGSGALTTSYLDTAGNAIQFTLNNTNDAFCYRYKIHESRVMMRNTVWRP